VAKHWITFAANALFAFGERGALAHKVPSPGVRERIAMQMGHIRGDADSFDIEPGASSDTVPRVDRGRLAGALRAQVSTPFRLRQAGFPSQVCAMSVGTREPA
jgi:hypothetical protein